MSYKLNKIIFQRDYEWGYESYTYDLNTEIEFPFAAGMMNELVPKEKSQISKYKPEISEVPLFNEQGLGKFIPEIGSKGIYYLELRSGNKIKQLAVDPDDVVVDIYIGLKDTLIYSFFNTTRKNTISITCSIVKDPSVYNKIKTDLNDIYWRQYFIRLAKNIDNDVIAERIPAHMTADQVAAYLQLDKKTIRNWTSEGKIPFVKLGSAIRYPKERIDNWLKSKEKSSSKRRASM